MTSQKSSLSDLSAYKDPDVCPQCKGPLSLRPASPYPTTLQIIFAVSFIVFMFLYEKLPAIALWTWSALQVSLGILLIRARIRSQKRVLRCVRCQSSIR